MPTVVSHAIADVAVTSLNGRALPGRFVVACALCSMVPDADVIGFRFGVHYGDVLGHRGLTHSVAFAAAIALLIVAAGAFSNVGRRRAWAWLFVGIVSHGVLDAATNGGLGVAFWAPFDNTRYFLPWRPILVSPIGLTRVFSDRGAAVLFSELLWVWLPSAMVLAATWIWRSRPVAGRRFGRPQ